jgi:hypothetical protein
MDGDELFGVDDFLKHDLYIKLSDTLSRKYLYPICFYHYYYYCFVFILSSKGTIQCTPEHCKEDNETTLMYF